ncbi:MAG: DUF885 domain-containing protein [bacterium]|nr:DUF885 domain-containing protein [bacterium]
MIPQKNIGLITVTITGLLFIFITVLNFCGTHLSIKQLNNDYIEKWKQFYPSQALANGEDQAAFRFETISPGRVNQWLKFNQGVLIKLDGVGELDTLSLDDRIDARLLKRQVLLEIESWKHDRRHNHSADFYSQLIAQAVTYILARDRLKPGETREAVLNRLNGIDDLCRNGIRNLKNGSPRRTRRSVEMLEKIASFYETKLPGIAGIQKWVNSATKEDFKRKAAGTAGMIRQLANHIKQTIIPNMTLPDAMGREAYSRKLRIVTDSSLTPKQLETIAMEEIETVRRMMTITAGDYWQTKHPGQEKPDDLRELMDFALEAMESHRASDQQGFLNQFKQLIDDIETFVKTKKIATLTGKRGKRTLFTALSPAHFAGAAVGGVYASGPFNPGADTLFYLPTVPDSAPQDVKDGFYRSFNDHFNAMIIAHEIMPGHYFQLKVAAHLPRPVRALFPGEVFVEGWGTFCEQITIQQGWGDGDPLTYLAHLRKRLENAVRAYTSVQVHCNSWNKEQLIRFAIEKGLLAPQFATNLWDRVIHSPHQLPSYFLGFRAFDRLLQQEKERLGKEFRLGHFCDTILETGAAPIDLLPLLMK